MHDDGDERPVRVLVLCHANVARSVAAAALLQGATDERGIEVELRSAGTHATDGQPPSSRTLEAMRLIAPSTVLPSGHRARQLRDEDVAWADLVVTMEASQVAYVRRRHPDGAARAATIAMLASALPRDGRPLQARVASMGLAELESLDLDDVADPAGGDGVAYEAAITALVELCGQLSSRLGG